MKTLAFYASTPERAREIVNFWNPYCKHLSISFSGNFARDFIIYVISYSDDYKIFDYRCLNSHTESFTHYYEEPPRFMDFPEEIRNEIIKRSVSGSPIPFIINPTTGGNQGGLTWGATPEGHDFWSRIISGQDFTLFYKRFNIEKDESRLCNKETPFGGGSIHNTSGVRCRFNKARISFQPLSYQEISGRG